MKILRAPLKHDVHGLLYALKSWSPVRLLGTFRSFRTDMPELHRRIRVSSDTRLKRDFVSSSGIFTSTFGFDCG
jgi:hypothetical protein